MKTKFHTTLFLFIILSGSSLISTAQTYFQKVYVSSPHDQEGQDVLPTSDGGYMIAGYTTNSTQYDCNVYLIKTDANGNMTSSKNYGGAKPDFPYHMIQTTDGNFFVIGYSQSYGGGDMDVLLLKVDQAGDLIWQKTYGGFGNDQGQDIIPTADGNYVIIGSSNSGVGSQEMNLIKIDPAGGVIWSKYIGGSAHDYGHSVKQCSDGGYILLGHTFSYGVNGDAYLVKTDGNGDYVWGKNFGGAAYDEGAYINVNGDGSFTFLIRDSSTVGQDVDIRVTKTDDQGNTIWSKTYGGTKKDTPKMIQPTSDGGYIVGGHSRSFGWINPDMWILKLNNAGDTTWTRHYGGVNNEHCYVVREQPDGSYIAVGKTASYGPDMDPIFLKLNSNGTFAVGINEYVSAPHSVNLYPNPSDGDLTIDLQDFKATKLTVADALGQEIYTKEFEPGNIVNLKFTDTKPGVYFIKCESETGSVTKKLIIN
jgi:hypothetical protein